MASHFRKLPGGWQNVPPNFLAAAFTLVRESAGQLAPRLVKIQAFFLVQGQHVVLCSACREDSGLPGTLGSFLGNLGEKLYNKLLTIMVLKVWNPKSVAFAGKSALSGRLASVFLQYADLLKLQLKSPGPVFADVRKWLNRER
jgi:hypothetical protein